MRRGAAVTNMAALAPRSGTFVLSMVACLLSVPALAAPRNIDDCEAIKDADAYNRCLASFGPTRGERGASYPGVASEGARSGKASGRSAYRPRPRFGGAQLSSGRGGRMRMEFTPGRR